MTRTSPAPCPGPTPTVPLHRPVDARSRPSRGGHGTGCSRRRASADAVLALDVPPGVVGRVRRDGRAEHTWCAVRRPGIADGRRRRSCPSCTAEVTRTPRPRPTAGDGPRHRARVFMAASYHADYATILCAPADLPAVAARGRVRPAATTADGRLGCHRPAPAAARRPGSARARGRVPRRSPAAWQVRGRAGGRLPGRDPPRRWRLGRLPRDARQEGAPRDPAQAAPRRGGRAGRVPDAAARRRHPWTSFIALHQARWGDAGPVPRHARMATGAGGSCIA